MGQSKEISLRHKVVADRGLGDTYGEISLRYGIGYCTVRTWCQRHSQEGNAGLSTRYHHCGRRSNKEQKVSFRLVRLTAYFHPDWGIPFILCRIRIKYPELPLQSVRHYQRQCRVKKAEVPAPTLPREEKPDRARQPHEVWEIDAKERIPLKDGGGAEVCFLNFTDEKTCALLKAKSFPPKGVSVR
jgi:hypothetical protein